MTSLLDGLKRARLLAIIRGSERTASVRTAVALVEEGITYLEVSLNTPEAIEVIAAVRREVGDRAAVGAGTVLTGEDAARVADAGGQFLVTPAVTAAVDSGVLLGLPVLAGAMTPTEAFSAMDRGATAIKLFPASLGGPAYLSALRDPFPNIPFIPVGGVSAEAAAEYLARGAVAVGVGSPLIGDAAGGGDLDALRRRAQELLRLGAGAAG
ncbi:bifunctional 4-hydroxy-2-oxoglutarate aldolase/2-dehydro-3-deoxy-phosphogluconate aldolase [Arthrobacter sp. EH-1B-1]|uniref:Bifunctional 4-hydroxy-2-oxoglutarate aldolase/2-dehydro-3-deoxy-phosphogluconate aldolase n=1 Tax=Arthrobacter vasquezii TaxID=2977629 RepID=A0ABT6CZI5_9MICC|nr:bifunctional 4-hydroxy-2-oxoglutarate aldolase/2-dehydro-3-deoxy-phosphogluconate aldolase [Arthrobacter vasquezii]MDF9279443.1 bifunctional 4-hydroxy-2-oxoglutarate aldolase/2-dehydro-3-deoxy-phosphogluconate aldolase [Arthrobacter vasquezii]